MNMEDKEQTEEQKEIESLKLNIIKLQNRLNIIKAQADLNLI